MAWHISAGFRIVGHARGFAAWVKITKIFSSKKSVPLHLTEAHGSKFVTYDVNTETAGCASQRRVSQNNHKGGVGKTTTIVTPHRGVWVRIRYQK